MTAGITGIAPGTAKASGNTTSELRVAELNDTALLAVASSLNRLDTTHPMTGAMIANAT